MPQGETRGCKDKCPLLPKGSLESPPTAENKHETQNKELGALRNKSQPVSARRKTSGPLQSLAELRHGNWVTGV